MADVNPNHSAGAYPRYAEYELVQELASFALRNPGEKVLGTDQAMERQLQGEKRWLSEKPQYQSQPHPRSVEIFRKVVEGTWAYPAPDTLRKPVARPGGDSISYVRAEH